MKIRKVFRFEAAHWLPHVPEGHKCARLHGHSYRVELDVELPIDPHAGWVMDFGELSKLWRENCEPDLDHQTLNDILDNPTAELLCMWIVGNIKSGFPLDRVAVWETPNSCAILDPNCTVVKAPDLKKSDLRGPTAEV